MINTMDVRNGTRHAASGAFNPHAVMFVSYRSSPDQDVAQAVSAKEGAATETDGVDTLDLFYSSDSEQRIMNKLWRLYSQYDDVGAANLAMNYLNRHPNRSLTFYKEISEFVDRLHKETRDPEAKRLFTDLKSSLGIEFLHDMEQVFSNTNDTHILFTLDSTKDKVLEDIHKTLGNLGFDNDEIDLIDRSVEAEQVLIVSGVKADGGGATREVLDRQATLDSIKENLEALKIKDRKLAEKLMAAPGMAA